MYVSQYVLKIEFILIFCPLTFILELICKVPVIIFCKNSGNNQILLKINESFILDEKLSILFKTYGKII